MVGGGLGSNLRNLETIGGFSLVVLDIRIGEIGASIWSFGDFNWRFKFWISKLEIWKLEFW